MTRIDKSKLTKIEIIQVATSLFLEVGYSKTSPKMIADKLKISTGNLTYHYPTKEHLLAVLVEMLCKFQWNLMKQEMEDGTNRIMAICLELMSMASACEKDDVARDFFISAYTSPMCIDIIRRNDADRAKTVFGEYCGEWDEKQFAEAEILVSGIEYSTLMVTEFNVPLDIRITGALNQILSIYNVPEETRKIKIKKVLDVDYIKTGKRILKEFTEYVKKANDDAFDKIISGIKS